MVGLVQANARVPAAARPALLSVASRLRDDPGFLDRLQAFMADEAGGSPWADRISMIESRLEALTFRTTELTKRKPGNPNRDEETGTFVPNVDNVHDRPERPADNSADWPARAAAITISTGEGRGRKLTAEGAALFEDMVRAGVRNPEIARILGMAKQSVHTRAKKVLAASS